MKRSARTFRRSSLAPLVLVLACGVVAPAVMAPNVAVATGSDFTEPFVIETDGTAPLRLAASPDGRHLFVANQSSSAITVIDTVTNAQVDSIPLAVNGNGVTVAADGTLWATQRTTGQVAKIISPLSDSPVVTYYPETPNASDKPTSLALSPSGDTLYVNVVSSGPTTSRVVARSTATGAVVDESASVANAASTISVAPDGSVWLPGDTPSVFPADLDSSQAIPGTGSRAGQVAHTADGTTAYVAVVDEVKVVETATMTVRDTIAPPAFTHAVGSSPFGNMAWLALSPDEETLYAVDYNNPAMAVIDIDGALAEEPGSVTQIDGPTADPEDAGDWDHTAYLNSVAAVGNAFYVAVDGTNFDGTTVMRHPVAPKVAPLGTATPGGDLTLTGSALVGATATVGGQPATVRSSSYSQATVTVPELRSLTSTDDVPVVVTTESGTVTTQVDAVVAAGTPTITGTARVGATLTAAPGSWTPGTSLGYQWLVGGQPASGTTGTTFTPGPADVGKPVTVQVTGTYGAWARTVSTSAATSAVVRAPLSSSRPKVTGKAKVGKRLAVRTGTWTAGTGFRYQWYAGKRAITKATKSRLKLKPTFEGKRIKVKVTGTKPGFTTVTKTSKATKPVR